MLDQHYHAYPHRIEEVDPWYVLPVYRVEGKGVLWYTSMVTGFLFKPIQPLRKAVHAVLESLSLLEQPFIGVQVWTIYSVVFPDPPICELKTGNLCR